MNLRKAFLLFLCALPLLAVGAPRNIIVMIPDGCATATLTVAREVKGAPLALDGVVYGLVQTRSADSEVTDSAAAATAMSCGALTYNGAISVDVDRRPMLTFGEWAKAQNRAVGIVTTDIITGATPAAFSAHAENRNQTDALIEGQIGSGIDLFLGGGTALLTPERREALKARGYALPDNAQALEAVKQGPVFGLFGKNLLTPMVARRNAPCAEPTLRDMSAKALELLSQDPDGFFLMIEGAQIDKGAHVHDLAWSVHELLAFDDAVALVLDWAKAHPDTVVLIAPDHETGGLTLPRVPKERQGLRAKRIRSATQIGAYKPEALDVCYSTGDHTAVDVFLAGNTPTVRPFRNCDFPVALADRDTTYLPELTGTTVEENGIRFLITPNGTRLRANYDAIYIPSTQKWYARQL